MTGAYRARHGAKNRTEGEDDGEYPFCDPG